MAQVVLKDICKLYPGVPKPAVDRVSLEIRDGEFMVLVGPSGCGKSTTLRMVAGLEDVTSGDVLIADRRVNDVPPKDRDVGMIFQNYALYPHKTVYKNMSFPLEMRRFPKTEIDARVREVAAMLELTGYLDRKPRALSGGQRQRVAVGRAIVRRPRVFLFDEPLSNLDAKMRVVMRNEIVKLHRGLGNTMIYVTHDQVEAMTMGDRIAVMNDGRLLQADAPRTLYDRPRNMFVAGFIGSPPMNFLRGRLHPEADSLWFEGAGARLALPPAARAGVEAWGGDDVVLGLRPEEFSERPPADPADPAHPANPNHSTLTALIEAVEPLGAETLLHLRSGDGPHSATLVARLGRDATGAVGETKTLSLSLDRAHFFDPSTEERITTE